MARIVVMHAESTVRMVLQEILLDEGYEVATADNGESAVRLIRAWQPGLVILGFVLGPPWKTNVYNTLRNDPVTQDLPVIILQSSPVKKETYATGFSLCILNEPYNIFEFLQVVETMLGTKRVA